MGEGHTRVLVVEDEAAHARLIRRVLLPLDLDVDTVASGAEAFCALQEHRYSLVVLDVCLPDVDGFAVQRWIAGLAEPPPIIFATAEETTEKAVAAVREGAADYIVKRPGYFGEVARAVSRVLGTPPPRPRAVRQASPGPMRGVSPAIEDVRRRILRYGPAEATVLIQGETGTGKELVARAVHEQSQRAAGPFVAVNCAAIPDTLLEAEFFGAVRGAYTGIDRDRDGLIRRADGGTLFLDEIGDMPLSLQAKLLRFLELGVYRPVGGEDAPVDVRVVAATNRDLAQLSGDGHFRADLHHRLDVLRIDVPPLRERIGDVPVLAEHFVESFCEADPPPRITREGLARLMAEPWPGNVRELKHTIQRAVLEHDGPVITAADLGFRGLLAAPRALATREDLVELLVRHGGRVGPIARECGVSTRTVQRRMKRWNVLARDFRGLSPTH